MLKPQTKEPIEESLPQEAYTILCDLSSKIRRHDPQMILGQIHIKQLMQRNNYEQLHLRGKKLFHIDLRKQVIYWEFCSEKNRIIDKQCMHTGQLHYKWKFEDKRISARHAIEVLGKTTYNILNKRSANNPRTLKTIHLNAFNDYYTNFEDFLVDLVDLINERLMQVYDGSLLKLRNPRSNFDKENAHQNLWEWYSYEMTRFWTTLSGYLKTERIHQRYNQALYNDINELFNLNTTYKCKEGLTQRPLPSQNRINYSYMKKCYPNDSLPKSFDSSKSLIYAPLKFNIALTQSDLIEISADSEFSRYPNAQRYPWTDTIEHQISTELENLRYMRKSLKRPANTCHQNCICLKDNGAQCPNLMRKVECQNHSCSNSQIREKKDMLCCYKDQEKNYLEIKPKFLYDKLNSGHLLHEFHSFGIDLYTTSILLNLMPLARVEDENKVSNEAYKKRLIENIIPYELSVTQNLFQAIINISSNQTYKELHYEAKVLEKKLIWIGSLLKQNNLAKLRGQKPFIPNLRILNGYYMGLGVVNIGIAISKGKFIGKFVGQLLCSWREEEKQIISTKHNQNPQNQGNEIKFYCITVQSHFDQESQPKSFSVDPQNIGNFCRSLNHSCDPNCKVEVMVSQGKYFLGVYAIKDIQTNDQLTFDYDSVTDNYEEYKHSVCLCGSLNCRGRYLKFQDEIYQGLDLDFLENVYPLKSRIKKLIKECSITDPERKEQQHLRSIKKLNERKVAHSCLPKELDIWIYLWIRVLDYLIRKETEFLSNNNDNFNKKYEKMDPEKYQRLLQVMQKEKLCILNSRIEKIAHLFSSIEDFQPPLVLKQHQELLEHLQKYLNENKDFSFQNVSKPIKPEQKTEQLLKKIRRIRYGLLEVAEKQYKKGNLDSSHAYLKKAFQFSLVQTHIYPDYESKPVQIWMQNTRKIEETVVYYGKDLYILQTLIAWPGEFKKIYKKLNHQVKRKKKTQGKERYETIPQMNAKFKRQYMKQQIFQAAEQIYEQKYGLDKLDVVKDKKLMHKNVNFTKLKEVLDKWILKQISFIKKPENQSSKKVLRKKQTKSSKKPAQSQQSSLKSSPQNSWDSKILPNQVDNPITQTINQADKSSTIFLHPKANLCKEVQIQNPKIQKKPINTYGKHAKKGGKKQLKQFDLEQQPSVVMYSPRPQQNRAQKKVQKRVQGKMQRHSSKSPSKESISQREKSKSNKKVANQSKQQTSKSKQKKEPLTLQIKNKTSEKSPKKDKKQSKSNYKEKVQYKALIEAKQVAQQVRVSEAKKLTNKKEKTPKKSTKQSQKQQSLQKTPSVSKEKATSKSPVKLKNKNERQKTPPKPKKSKALVHKLK